MSLHLIKLSVGTESVEDLKRWNREHLRLLRSAGHTGPRFHTTRMVPKRVDELLDGGSIYWVIKGQVQARQKLVGIEPFTDRAGIRRCRLMLGDKLVETHWQPKRPFQGWRYLKGEDAPTDLKEGNEPIPAALRADLSELGLL
ncbi:MAG: DUF1489 domain-containing protein [Pseudomonadota bacterium]